MHFMRPYQSEADYWRIRSFLREVFVLNERHESSWQTARLDYWWWFGNPRIEHYRFEEVIYLWETAEGQIAAVLTPESRGNAYLNVHPHFRTPELEAEMVAAAEMHLAECSDDGGRKLMIWAHQQDELRQSLLKQGGYVKGDCPEYQRQRSLDIPIPDSMPAPGYSVGALREADELPARSWLSWRVFHPHEPDEQYGGWEWYRDIQRCPLYRRDLDLVATAPDGTLAGFCTVWYDDVTRAGYFEPVGVSPDHQWRGLGKALMCEGLRRLKWMGAILATVAGFSTEANALYASVMSPDYTLLERWEKML